MHIQDLAQEARKNWAGNIIYGSIKFYEPSTIEELQQLVKATDYIKVLGSTHSFNTIADTRYSQVSLRKLNRIVHLDKTARMVKIEAGITYSELAQYLNSHGFALHNLASLPHISVAGACATATHGSGISNGNLASAIIAIELITATGELRLLSREADPDTFLCAEVGLGALGIIATLTLKIELSFLMEQRLYERLSFARFAENPLSIFASGYSVSLFTDYQEQRFSQVWVKKRLDAIQSNVEGLKSRNHLEVLDEKADSFQERNDDKLQNQHAESLHAPPDLFGASPAQVKLHPVAGESAINCTEQLGQPGPWFERLPHFKMEFTPSIGNELQSEYYVPLQFAADALFALEQLKDSITPLLLISEVRAIAADDAWMSPCYQKTMVAFHFTWKPAWQAVRQLLPILEARLAAFDAIPHWGKLYTMKPETVKSRYPKYNDFKRIMLQLDPGGKFSNDYLEPFRND